LWSLFIGGVLLIVFELWHKEGDSATEELETIPFWKAAAIGVFQSLAMVPGVSRAAATIIGGLLLGIRRRAIVEFSFLLAVPTMLAATVLDLLKSGSTFTPEQYVVLAAGFLTSFLIAMASIKFLLFYIKAHNFIPFGVYRILLAVVYGWWMVR
jgi:undecaprenyl-diphosphatase